MCGTVSTTWHPSMNWGLPEGETVAQSHGSEHERWEEGEAQQWEPCKDCPLNDGRAKVPPTLPEGMVALAVGLAPGRTEEQQGQGFVGEAGQLLRSALTEGGLNPTTDVGYANLTRCRPNRNAANTSDDFESKDWKKAATRCRKLLDLTLALHPDVPLLALGAEPAKRLTEEKLLKITAARGLWYTNSEGRKVFASVHPASILHVRGNPEAYRGTEKRFRNDIKTFASTLTGTLVLPPMTLYVYHNPGEAAEFCQWMATVETPWAFDTETFDGKASPSRKSVSTDPCHPDFRLRGLAVSWNSTSAAYIELMTWQDRIAEARAILSPMFASAAEKWGFNAHFDEEALVFPGWVDHIRNRRGDGLLGMIALGDGRRLSHTLERAVVDYLKEPPYWSGFDKSYMGTAPLEQVSESCARDALSTRKLCLWLHKRFQQGKYLEG